MTETVNPMPDNALQALMSLSHMVGELAFASQSHRVRVEGETYCLVDPKFMVDIAEHMAGCADVLSGYFEIERKADGAK